MNVICGNCRKELNEGAEFCNECGEKVIPPIEDIMGKSDSIEIEKFEEKKVPASKKQKSLNSIALLFAIVGVIFWCVGFYKYFIYSSGEFYPYESVNAYVGGDAYNLIINGTYFAAFSVIGGTFLISAVVLYTASFIKNKED